MGIHLNHLNPGYRPVSYSKQNKGSRISARFERLPKYLTVDTVICKDHPLPAAKVLCTRFELRAGHVWDVHEMRTCKCKTL